MKNLNIPVVEPSVHPVTRRPRVEARGGMVVEREATHLMPRPEGRGNGVHYGARKMQKSNPKLKTLLT
ncbi:MAG: hypothetical protein UX72_C0040G0005 [Parcubacteria group bacterium GW2011_GWA2_47_10]|nr:MAG: hypothetical protein UX72_C0040G0005 [Parcubacteria group bacterium GW2011_GWA2_47_10]